MYFPENNISSEKAKSTDEEMCIIYEDNSIVKWLGAVCFLLQFNLKIDKLFVIKFLVENLEGKLIYLDFASATLFHSRCKPFYSSP